LREALAGIARDHEARTGQKIALTFGASGLLRERIEQAAPADTPVFTKTFKFPQAVPRRHGLKLYLFTASAASRRGWRQEF
jgi:molybdate transport system substrate-binding protein